MSRIATARALRKRMSPPEARLWLALRPLRKAGWHFRRQHPLCGYYADFACVRARLIVEVDGAQHDHPTILAHDRVRTAAFVRVGYRTIRFSNADVRDHLEWVVDRILTELQDRSPPPPCQGSALTSLP